MDSVTLKPTSFETNANTSWMALCIPYHRHTKINEYTMDQWVEYIIVVTRHVINEQRKTKLDL
jgi:hypothetical protein